MFTKILPTTYNIDNMTGITSTELKQNTRKEKQTTSGKRPDIKDLEKFFIKIKNPINSAALIRKMRDEE